MSIVITFELSDDYAKELHAQSSANSVDESEQAKRFLVLGLLAEKYLTKQDCQKLKDKGILNFDIKRVGECSIEEHSAWVSAHTRSEEFKNEFVARIEANAKKRKIK